MIIPTLAVNVLDRTAHNRFGEPALTKIASEKVAVVRLRFVEQQTTVRTDSSGSHGQAREAVAEIKLLALPKTVIKQGSGLEFVSGAFVGRRVVVTVMHERYDVLGRLDHYEVDCEAWV